MRQGFVPLVASARAPAAEAGAPAKAPAEGHPQRPFRALTAPVAPAPAGAPTASGEPVVTVERDGQRVTRIVVQCPCGHVIELAVA
jgi:hypothetical protein